MHPIKTWTGRVPDSLVLAVIGVNIYMNAYFCVLLSIFIFDYLWSTQEGIVGVELRNAGRWIQLFAT